MTKLELAMLAGAYAITNSRFGRDGGTYVKGVFSPNPEEIPFGEAAKVLSDTVEEATRTVENAPAFDVDRNRHAHWIEKDNPMYSPFDGSDPHIFYCSHCGKIDGKKYPFCHVCGFMMDEEAQQNDKR